MKENRITAYALNELQGDERDQFESDLAADELLQRELASASRVADGLAQVMTEPREGLEPRAREKLLRAIAANQEALRTQREVVRWAMPVSLAAAASIAVLLWVTGGKTTQEPAVAAADGGGDASAGEMHVAQGTQGGGFAGRTIRLSERAQAVEMRLENKISMTDPPVRVKPFVWDERLPRLGSSGPEQP